MDTLSRLEFLGRIKEAEMELSEAAFKEAEGDETTARACLKIAADAILGAMELTHR